MKKTVWVTVVLMVIGAVLMAACGGGNGGSGSTRELASPPAEYANMTNPVAGDASAVAAGRDLYAINCTSCHGAEGRGDGAAAAALDPKPSDLQDVAKRGEPQYIHWVIAEGGPAAGLSASMVAYKGILTDEQIWQITTFIEETYGK